MFDLTSHSVVTSTIIGSITFVVGWVAGIYSKFYSDKLTDRRRENEAKAKILKRFNECRQQMPKLFEEMVTDFSRRMSYEFVVVDVNLTYGGFTHEPYLYFGDHKRNLDYLQEKRNVWIHANLLNKARTLEQNDFISDVSTTSVPRFRMSQQFVELIKSEVPLPKESPAPTDKPPQ